MGGKTPIFNRICAFDNLHAAFRRAFSGSGRTEGACRFHYHLEPNLLSLRRELLSGAYHPAPYRYFKVFDPKERTISVAPFKDRVVHHAVVGVLEPLFERRFIYDSYATRKGKGTHRAVRRAQGFLRKYTYFLETDVEKYFYSIDHGILMGLIGRCIKDLAALELVGRILANSDRSRGLAAGRGLPIGNLTSQFFANVYLDPLDHFIKDDMGIKGYVRYMDDLVVFGPKRDELKRTRDTISQFLGDRPALDLKPRATMINGRLNGLTFLGYRIFPRLIRVRRENLNRSLRRFRRRERQWDGGEISEGQMAASLGAVTAHPAFKAPGVPMNRCVTTLPLPTW